MMVAELELVQKAVEVRLALVLFLPIVFHAKLIVKVDSDESCSDQQLAFQDQEGFHEVHSVPASSVVVFYPNLFAPPSLALHKHLGGYCYGKGNETRPASRHSWVFVTHCSDKILHFQQVKVDSYLNKEKLSQKMQLLGIFDNLNYNM